MIDNLLHFRGKRSASIVGNTRERVKPKRTTMLEEGLTSVAKLVEALTIWWCLRLFSHGAGFEVQEVGMAASVIRKWKF